MAEGTHLGHCLPRPPLRAAAPAESARRAFHARRLFRVCLSMDSGVTTIDSGVTDHAPGPEREETGFARGAPQSTDRRPQLRPRRLTRAASAREGISSGTVLEASAMEPEAGGGPTAQRGRTAASSAPSDRRCSGPGAPRPLRGVGEASGSRPQPLGTLQDVVTSVSPTGEGGTEMHGNGRGRGSPAGATSSRPRRGVGAAVPRGLLCGQPQRLLPSEPPEPPRARAADADACGSL